MKLSIFALAALSTLAVVAGNAHDAAACTGIRLEAKDGAVVYARTMEFAENMGSNPLVIPRNLTLRGTTRSGKPGLTWETKYGAVGLNGLGQMVLCDGINEKGLAGGIFLHPGYAEYQTVTAADESSSIAPWEVVTWFLTNFSTVEEVATAIKSIKVADVPLGDTDLTPPLHYIVHDPAGNSMVIEYLHGQLSLNADPVGVITNAPDFDWHIKNLSNYVKLTPENASSEDIEGLTVNPFGQGSGLLGVPGDFTPPSRFVRAVVLSRSAVAGETGEQAVRQAFHVLDSFDIPMGSVRAEDNGRPVFERTQWTSASDMRNLVFYFHTYDNRRVRQIDLQKVNFDAPQILLIHGHDQQEDYHDLTPSQNGG